MKHNFRFHFEKVKAYSLKVETLDFANMDNLRQEYKNFLQGNTVRGLENWKNNEEINKDLDLALADKDFDTRSEEILKSIERRKNKSLSKRLAAALKKH